MRVLILTLLLINSTAFAQSRVNFCHTFLANHTELSFTEIFYVYLQELHRENIVSTESLNTLKVNLESKNALTNPVFNKASSDYDIHFDQVSSYLTSSELDQIVLLEKITEFLKQLQGTKENKEESKEQTKDSNKQMKFNKILSGGDYIQVYHQPNGVIITEEPVHVAHSFLMMDSLVSEYMFVKVINQKDQKTYAEFFKHFLGNRTSPGPEFPVTMIKRVEAAYFANLLSELHGLKPAYKIEDKGTLSSEATIDAPNGDITQTEGYRLPTWQENGLVRTNRGEAPSNKMLPIINKNNVHQYIGTRSSPVAEQLPIQVDQQLFYDIYKGTEWLDNPIPCQNEKLAKPQYPSYSLSIEKLTCFIHSRSIINSSELGFRLVRTIKPEKQP